MNNAIVSPMFFQPKAPTEIIVHPNTPDAVIYLIAGGIFITMLILVGGMIWLSILEMKSK